MLSRLAQRSTASAARRVISSRGLATKAGKAQQPKLKVRAAAGVSILAASGVAASVAGCAPGNILDEINQRLIRIEGKL